MTLLPLALLGSSLILASGAPAAPRDRQAPTVPTGLALVTSSPLSLQLGWNASSDNIGVVGYGLYRNGTKVASQAARSYTFSGLACNTLYTLAVDAYDAAGNRSKKAQLTATTAACQAVPQNVVPPAISGVARVGFQLSASVGSWSGATSYAYQWQAEAATGTFASISSASAATYTATAADQGRRLRVVVTASNGSGSASAVSAPTAAVEPAASPTSVQQAVDGTPDGGVVSLENRAYSEGTINLSGRSNLTIDGNGATIQGAVGDGHAPVFRVTNGSNITLRELTLDGGYASPGVFSGSIQWSHGIEFLGTNGASVEGTVTIRNVSGDCIYAGMTSVRSTGIRVGAITCAGTGRNGLSVVSSNDFRADGGSYTINGYNNLNIEPNATAGQGVNGAVLNGMIVGNFAGPVSLSVVGASPVDNVTFSNIRSIGSRGALIRARADGPRFTNLTYTGITSDNPTSSADSIGITNVDGLTVTNNRIPNAGGAMLICNSVTNVVFSGNTPSTTNCSFSATSTSAAAE